MTRLSWLTRPFRDHLSLRLSGIAALAVIFGFAAVLVSLGVLTSDPDLVSRLFFVACPLVFLICLILSWTIGRQLSGLHRLARLALRLREQDVLSEFPAPSEDEVGLLIRALRNLRETVDARLARMGTAASDVIDAAQPLPGRSRNALEDSRGGVEGLETLHRRITALLVALQTAAENSRGLQNTAAGNAGAALTVDMSIQGVASNAEGLNLAVDEAAATIEQMASSIQQVAGSTGRLSGSMDEAVAVISRIETSIKQVEKDTRESSHLSEQVAQEAGRGSVAVRKTIEGMRRIRRSVQQTARVVRALGGRSKEIGEILHVIDEIAGQTNLLAINAAIIAAQAGEQGKGFALVAEEIRDLAERTAASTKEIDNLIRSVRREAAQAVDAMEEGLSSVEEGVHLSNNAGEALERILERADSSSSTSRAIAEAIQEQSFGSKKVTQEIENIRSMVKQINLATQAQAQASTLLTRVTREMKEHTADVNQATAEQVERSAALVAATSGLEREARQTHEELAAQAAVLGALSLQAARIHEAAASQVAHLAELDGGIGALMDRARLLSEESGSVWLIAVPRGQDT